MWTSWSAKLHAVKPGIREECRIREVYAGRIKCLFLDKAEDVCVVSFVCIT